MRVGGIISSGFLVVLKKGVSPSALELELVVGEI